MHLPLLLVNKQLYNCHLLILSKKLHNNHFCHLQRTRKLRNSHFCRLQRTRKQHNCHLLILRQKAPKDKEASPVKVMPPPPSHMTNPPPSPPYDTIHQDLALYKTTTHSNPMDQFFEAMKNLKSTPGTSSVMYALTQHAKRYMRACEIESYEEDGDVYNRENTISETT
jgi:hypothetical protein